jgi:hypothetical protein
LTGDVLSETSSSSTNKLSVCNILPAVFGVTQCIECLTESFMPIQFLKLMARPEWRQASYRFRWSASIKVFFALKKERFLV